jgi:phosphoribosylaminoimidazole carboxylase
VVSWEGIKFQLRMLNEAAARLNLKTCILDQDNSPAKQISNRDHVIGSFKDPEAIKSLASKSNLLTVEIEHVDTETLQNIKDSGVDVQPDPATIKLIQDKFAQKTYLQSQNQDIPIAPFVEVSADLAKSINQIGIEFGYPLMLKSKKLAYDGKGNRVVRSENDIQAAIAELGGDQPTCGGLYVEKWVVFKKELAVMVAKSTNGEIVSYPCVETIQKDNICHLVIAPAPIDGTVRDRARYIAELVVSSFSGAGIYGVELFMLENGDLFFNEVAPRPHNSGHYTIEGCHTSQFEQHLRCITGMPLGSPELKVPCAVMINIIGLGDGIEGMKKTLEACHKSLTVPGATLHLYGKADCKSGRKMGHITLVGDNMLDILNHVKSMVDIPTPPASPLVGIIMGSDSDLPTVKPAAVILKGFGVPFELTIVSAHRTPDRMVEYAKNAHLRGIKVIVAAAGGAAHLPGMVSFFKPRLLLLLLYR